MLALAWVPARAQVLIGEFPLRGNLNNNVPGGSSLVSLGGQITALGYVFGANQGLTFASSALNPTNYSIELSFNFTTVSGYTKITDFQNLSTDSGFYQLNGSLNFYGFGDIRTATQTDFIGGSTVDVVLTRDGATGTVVGYVNGQQRFTFVDSSNFAVVATPSNTFNFLVDDHATGQREASGGTLNYLRVFNGALTASQVSALFAAGAPSAVPEPATVWLLALGVLGLLAAGTRVAHEREPLTFRRGRFGLFRELHGTRHGTMFPSYHEPQRPPRPAPRRTRGLAARAARTGSGELTR